MSDEIDEEYIACPFCGGPCTSTLREPVLWACEFCGRKWLSSELAEPLGDCEAST